MGLLQLAVTWYMLEGKLPTGTSKTKKIQIYLDEVALFWMSQCSFGIYNFFFFGMNKIVFRTFYQINHDEKNVFFWEGVCYCVRLCVLLFLNRNKNSQ